MRAIGRTLPFIMELAGLPPDETRASAAATERWRKILSEGHGRIRFAHRLFRYLPSPPRCKVCHNPFGGVGGKLVGMLGFARSRKNPNLCAMCCDRLPPGGAELDIAVLFADVRGSTTMGELLGPGAYAARLNRFYNVATEVLVRYDAIIDKLIGDEVMALFIPGICGPTYHQIAAQALLDLLRAVGYDRTDRAWMPIGAAVNSGIAYVGNVGGNNVMDFTALGDPVNTAARLASVAAAGEGLLSETVYASVKREFPNLERRTLSLRGKEAPVNVRVLHPAAA
ncbi:MAG TPA: adenylate/guanylate cyclase domain-containing protein [Acidobacteriaceae bacterium]|nr:adenylate/guanylate cyclase domain-containing protein [Acidobacteriaceae bacterium]